MAKTQIIESFITKGQILEQESVNNAILCRAKYQICSIGEKNRNNRVYEKSVWDKVLADQDILDKLKNKSLFFHAEHPTTTQSNTEKVAGVVTNLTLNEAENKVYAVMEVLDTPYGRIVDTLLRAGCGIGVSTRADGELEEALDEAGNKFQRVVPESYRFVTIDFTADPSTFGSELPIAVERDVTNVIKGGLDDSKIDRDYATVLLEKLHSPEAVALLESIKNDKHHEDCKFKTSEKKCTHGCLHAVEEKTKWKCSCGFVAETGEVYDEKICPKCQKQMIKESMYNDIETMITDLVAKGIVDEEIIKTVSEKFQMLGVAKELLPGVIRRIRTEVKGKSESVNEVIKKVGGKWQVQSHKGKNLGTYDTEEEAKKRLKQVEFFKHKNEKTGHIVGKYIRIFGPGKKQLDAVNLKVWMDRVGVTFADMFTADPAKVLKFLIKPEYPEATGWEIPMETEWDDGDSNIPGIKTDEKYTTSSDKSGQPANAKAADKVAKKSAAKNKVKITETGMDFTALADEFQSKYEEADPDAFTNFCKEKGLNPEEQTWFGAELIRRLSREAGVGESVITEKGESMGDLSSLSDAEIITRYKALAKDTTNQEDLKGAEGLMKEIQRRGIEDKIMLIGESIEPKVKQFLTDNWGKFINEKDALDNLVKVFKIGESDAKKYMELVEKEKGKFSAVSAVVNEKGLPSGNSMIQLDELSKRLAFLTAERKQLVENYGKDAMTSTIKIDELTKQIGTMKLHEADYYKCTAENAKIITDLKEKLVKADEDAKVLKESNDKAIKTLQEERSADVKRITEEKQSEIIKLKEDHRKDVIKFYVSTKIKSMGLSLPEAVLTLLESCKSVDEVDAQIRKTQNLLRESLVQSAGGLSEIVIEAQSDPNPNLTDIRNKVGIVLKHLGV